MARKSRIALVVAIVVLALLLAALIGVAMFIDSDQFLQMVGGQRPQDPQGSSTQTTIAQANGYTLTMTLDGETEITLEYGSEFTAPEAVAWVYSEKLGQEGLQLSDITVNNPVDTSKVGSYTVTYSVTYSNEEVNLSTSKTCTVHIVDTQVPVITLEGDPNRLTYPGRPYEEEGFTAMDGYDGDITDRVERVEENGVVTYRVKDSSGNEAIATRKIVYGDKDAPVLSLKGDNPMKILVGTDFVEPGVIAWDACDGYLSEQVTISQIQIDPYVPNNYTITYSVTDKSGNTATLDRELQVVGADNPETVTPEGKVIYLTFDDGPGPYTEQLLDVLKKYNVKATFFVVDTGSRYHDVLRRIVNEGHAIGVHCTKHTYSEIYASDEAYFADMENMKRIIFEQTGVSTQLIRFPGGSSNTASKYYSVGIMTRLTKALRARGYQYFDWNVDSNDAGGAKTAEQVYNNVIKGCGSRRVSVVLQHDIKKYSVEAVEDIIIWGLANGYQFLPLDVTSPHAHHGLNN